MNKFQKIGLAILAIIAVAWLMKGCASRFRPGYRLAKQLKSMDIGISSIKIEESSTWFENIKVEGHRLKFRIMHMGNNMVYEQWEKMMREAAENGRIKREGKTEFEGKAAAVILSRPFIIWVSEEPSDGFMEEKIGTALGEVKVLDFSGGG